MLAGLLSFLFSFGVGLERAISGALWLPYSNPMEAPMTQIFKCFAAAATSNCMLMSEHIAIRNREKIHQIITGLLKWLPTP
jgi:hypothetical protein